MQIVELLLMGLSTMDCKHILAEVVLFLSLEKPHFELNSVLNIVDSKNVIFN